MNSTDELLFRLRFSEFYFEDGVRVDLEPLRPLVRVDERTRRVLMNVVLEAEYLNTPSRECLDLLLDELPDCPQAWFLLHWHAYEYRGEDSMGTESARNVMCRRGPPEPRLRREVEQTFLNRSRIDFNEWESVGKDLYSDFVAKKFREWAETEPRYIPTLLAAMATAYASVETLLPALARHPDFPLADYDPGRHPHELACRLAAAPARPSPAALIRAFRADRAPLRAIYAFRNHAPVESWSPGDFALMEEVAANPADTFHTEVRGLLARTMDISPLARDWVERQLQANAGDLTLHRNLAMSALDPEVAWNSIQVLADQHQEFVTVMQAIHRLAHGGRKPAPDRAVPMLTRAYRESRPDWQRQTLWVLKEYYADHPDTLRLVAETQVAAPIPIPEFQDDLARLLHIAKTTPNGWTGQRYAVTELAERFSNRSEVRALLFQIAGETQDVTPERCALLEILFRYPDAPETMELLTRPTTDATRNRLQRVAIRYLTGQPETFEDYRQQLDGDDYFARLAAPGALALWHGDESGIFELLARFDLKTLVARWPREARVFETLRAVLSDGNTTAERAVLAARLLSRAFSDHPQTPGLLRQFMNFRAAIFAEYLGLKMGDDAALEWGLSVLRELRDDPAHRDLAQAGPGLLVWFFGPRKDLLAKLRAMGQETTNPPLRAGIEEVFKRMAEA